MRVDCLERLRCPADHAASPLVTIATHRDGEHVMAGFLGCPVCGGEYVIQDGIARLGEAPAAERVPSDPADPWHLAAMLDLSVPARRVGLAGQWALAADAVQAATDARCLVLNAPPSACGMGSEAPDAVTLPVGAHLPVGDATLDGLALDHQHLPLLADATRALRAGGRLVAPVTATRPPGCRELARDAAWWVATVETTSTVSQPIPLRRQSLPSA